MGSSWLGRIAVDSHPYLMPSYPREVFMRENVLRDLARRAATDLTFLRQGRLDLQRTLARHGYSLTGEERRMVEGLLRQTASMTDEELARTLASGLEGRTGSPPARPASPSWRGSGPARPARPGR
jgi:hypothetical protein